MGSRAWSSTSAGLSSVNRHSNFGAVSKAVSTGHPAPAEIRNHLGVASSNPLFFWILCSYFIPQNWPKKIQKDTQSMKSMKSVWTEKTPAQEKRHHDFGGISILKFALRPLRFAECLNKEILSPSCAFCGRGVDSIPSWVEVSPCQKHGWNHHGPYGFSYLWLIFLIHLRYLAKSI